MGVVYKAGDANLGRFLVRIRRGARAASSLNHPNSRRQQVETVLMRSWELKEE
jgi:hypothetical protein